MIQQGRGHIVNISSIYGNAGTAGSGVYSATKAAVGVLSDSLRVEAQGKIKVTVVRPTGVPGTGLGASVSQPRGHRRDHRPERRAPLASMSSSGCAGSLRPRRARLDDVALLDAHARGPRRPDRGGHRHAVGRDISDITVRATGEDYVL